MEWPAPCLCYSHALCFSAFLHSFAKNSTDTRRLHRQTHTLTSGDMDRHEERLGN